MLRYERPVSTPRNVRLDRLVELPADKIRVVHAPSGAVEIYSREDEPTIVSLTGDGR